MALTQHEQDTVDLLSTLDNWIGSPSYERPDRNGLRVYAGEEWPDCPACAGEGKRRIRGMRQRCDRCEGRGLIHVDPYTGRELASSDTSLTLVEEVRADIARVNRDSWEGGGRRFEENKLRDQAIERLEQEARVRAGLEAVDDAWTRALERHDRQWAQGDYALVEAGLRRLDLGDQSALLAVYVLDVGLRVIDSALRARAGAAVRLLASELPEPLRVPGWARSKRGPEFDEAERQLLWRNRSWVARRRKAERDARILELHAEGLPPGKIGHRVGLSRQRVQQIVATELASRPLVLVGAVATGAA
jgi:hypothetical protein